MKWISHLAVAGASTAVFAPEYVAIGMAGGLAPDAFEMIRERQPSAKKIKHRTVTHFLVWWLFAMAFFWGVWDFASVGFWFAWGGLTHWFCDSLNASGVPVGWWSDRRVHLLGGRMRVGGGAEYATVMVFVAVCAAAIFVSSSSSGQRGFLPFFIPWAEHYRDGDITGKEWRENRFNFF